jgi:HlyD family secretion protein
VKIIVSVVVTVVVLGILAGVGMSLRGKSDSGKSEGTPVRVEPVKRGDLVEIVSAPGQLQPRTKVSISAKTTARIIELPFEEGASVKKDQVIVQLDAKDLQAQLDATEARQAAQAGEIEVGHARLKSQEAQIESARVQLADAERDLHRQNELLSTKDVSQSAVDVAQAKVDQLKAALNSTISSMEAEKASLIVSKHQLDAAKAEIARARDSLSYTTITSPIDGVITRLNAKVGEMVVTGTMNNSGTVILEVADLSEMQVDAQIDESNIASVHEGQKAKVRISAYPDETFDGTVKLVGLDVVDPRMGGGGGNNQGGNQGRWYRARVVVDTKNRRIPSGLSSDVDIETNNHKNVIKVPTQAVMGRPVDELPADAKNKPEVDKNKTLATVVFCYGDGKAKMTPVTIGASDMTHTEITSGLKDNDKVIIGPYKILPTLNESMKLKEDTSATSKPTTTTTNATTKPQSK